MRAAFSDIYILRYLQDSNAAAHSVDSDIFYAIIHLPARFNLNSLK